MFSALGLRTVFEIVLVGFVFWSVFNEDKFIAFEKRIASYIRRRRLKVVKPSAGVSQKAVQ